jgi:plastocyanin
MDARRARPRTGRSRRWRSDRLPLIVALVTALANGRALPAQSLLDRSPNVSGDWVGAPGTLQFDFLHRFTHAAAPTRKVVSSPTFLVAASLPRHTLVGVNYATNSDVAPAYPNEYELFGRFAPIAQDDGGLGDLGAQAGYNVAARSTDGELSIGRRVGPLQLRGAARIFSNAFDLGTTRTAFAGGAVLHLGRWLGLAGDFAGLLDRPAGYANAWSAGVQVAIPYTPHTLSIHATNTSTATLEGVSAARGTERRYGFEFTIPLTLGRYFSKSAPPSAAVADSGGAPVATVMPLPAATAMRSAPPLARDSAASRDSAVVAATAAPIPATAPLTVVERAARTVARVRMRQSNFTPSRIEITAGDSVSWTNRDALVHTVTGGGWDSGPVAPGASWTRRFDRPGRYTFHCTPHPFMTGVIVVRAAAP